MGHETIVLTILTILTISAACVAHILAGRLERSQGQVWSMGHAPVGCLPLVSNVLQHVSLWQMSMRRPHNAT